MHRVKYVTKNVEATDPNYRLITDRTESFSNFTNAMEFVRSLRHRLTGKEELIGLPTVEVA